MCEAYRAPPKKGYRRVLWGPGMVPGAAERQVLLQHGGKGFDEGWDLPNAPGRNFYSEPLKCSEQGSD